MSSDLPRFEIDSGIDPHIGEIGDKTDHQPDEGENEEIAEHNGYRVAAAGSYPTSIPSEQEIAPVDRYRDFVEYAGPAARRQGVSGLHVHIGMPDAETCFRVMETILPWLPFVLALSANSPYFEGRDTGMLSIRAEVLGFLPRHGAPPDVREPTSVCSSS